MRGPQKAISLFLIVYCLFASITEAGLDGPSAYVLDLSWRRPCSSPGGGGSQMTTRDGPIIIASLAREQGITGVHTHVRQLREFLARSDGAVRQVTPHSWAGRHPSGG